MHGMQWPQLGTNTSTTRSPGFKSCTPTPTSTTVPDASCPSAMGTGRDRTPVITDKSEWHKPAAVSLMSTSPKPGASRSISSIFKG